MNPHLAGLVVDHAPTLALFDGSPPLATFDATRTYRYTLTRRWAEGRVAAFVMLNPSTADASVDDPTIRRCIGFARAWGCGGLLVLNLFAFRATDPRDMKAADDPVGPANDIAIATLLAPPDGPEPVVAAWGAHGAYRGRARAVTGLLARMGVTLQCLGTTAAGQPSHPLYLPGDATLRPYPPPDHG